MRSFVWFAFAVLAGCATEQMTEPAAPVPPPLTPAPALQAVASGTDLHVTLEGQLSSRDVRAGEPIFARVDSPVRGRDGHVAVQAGALVRGHVAFVDREPKARIGIEFDAIDTVQGPMPIEATLVDAGPYATTGVGSRDQGYDALLFAPIGPMASVGGGPPTNEGAQPAPVYQIFMPRGSKLHLVLTSDLRTH